MSVSYQAGGNENHHVRLLNDETGREHYGTDDSNEYKNRSFRHGGLTVFWAAVFIAGEMAGSGVLALPKAVVEAGWIGLLLIVCFCVNAAYGGSRLGACWAIIEERYPEYRVPVRNPYPIIGLVACGRKTSVLVSVCIQITLFGAGTVYLLLASQIVQKLMVLYFPTVSICKWFALIAVLVSPVMWLGSPKDFRIVGIGAIGTTAFACICIASQIFFVELNQHTFVPHTQPTFYGFFIAFGTILFSFGGAATFPTIQNDMFEREKFYKSVIIGFFAVLLLYLPVAAGGFYAYGDSVQTNILLNLDDSLPMVFANILLAIHLVMAFLIVVNPVCQILEEKCNIPHKFHWKRCLIRSILLLIVVFVGETVPEFGKILALIGGSTITLLTFVFPQIFYMSLCDQPNRNWSRRFIPTYLRVYMWELILIGLMGGAACTYNALREIFNSSSLIKPCYM